MKELQKQWPYNGAKSNVVLSHQPCPCGESSDGYTVYDDGHGYCFASCGGTYFKNDLQSVLQKRSSLNSKEYKEQYLPWRGISRETMEKYDVRTRVDVTGSLFSISFPYSNGRYQIRSLDKKEFWSEGELNGKSTGFTFGVERFQRGEGNAITICEGPVDALSVYEMFGRKYPSVAAQSASSARKDVSADYDFINSFEKIYLCFDNDEPGQRAKEAVASLFDFNKVYDVRLDKYKDANEYLQAGAVKEFTQAWWNAKRFLPQGIISSYAELDKLIDEEEKKESVPYPFDKLQEMTYGIRTGEFVLLTAQEGIGKTEVFRALEYHLLKTTDAPIGIIHLEEGKSRIIKGLAGYELDAPVHLPDSSVTKDDIKKAIRSITKRDERVHIYTHFGSDDPDVILNTIRFMAGPCGCRYIFLDHITLVVTGLLDEDERRALDYISTKLAMMVEELDFCLFIISHVNDEGKTRGSRNISKVADLHIDLYRDLVAPTDSQRNTTELTIKKNRFVGRTGPSSKLIFDPGTFKISEQIELPQ